MWGGKNLISDFHCQAYTLTNRNQLLIECDKKKF